ncbi:TlpA disulfide reductase family protein [Acidaminococcus timonensis]|uniref:TlpA family protein disulfide reductase n=1 Tax=Acidaminococcus timonensis TaxID=1871002 RepID=UPI00307AA1FA
MKHKLFIPVLLTAFTLLLAGCGEKSSGAQGSAGSKSQATASQQAAAPGFTGKDLAGAERTIQPGDGKVYVLNFWATWCPPCRAEFPEMDQFAKAHKDRVAFYALNVQESGDKVQGFLQDNGYTLPVLLDRDGRAARLYSVRAIPTTVILDEKGHVLLRQEGMATARQLEEALKGRL